MSDAGNKQASGKGPLLLLEVSLRTVFRVALGGMLIYAAYNKIGDPAAAEKFKEAIAAYKMLPDHLVRVSVFAFPWMEIVAGVCLIAGLWTRASALIASALFIAFIYAIASALNNPAVNLTDCGCFGDRSLFCPAKPGACNIIQNIGFTLVSGWILLRGGGPAALDALCGRCGKTGCKV